MRILITCFKQIVNNLVFNVLNMFDVFTHFFFVPSLTSIGPVLQELLVVAVARQAPCAVPLSRAGGGSDDTGH